VILCCGASIDHRIGNPTHHSLLGRQVSTTNHPAWRRYYLTRNRILTWRAAWRQAPAWVAFDAFGHWRDTMFMTLFESGRGPKLAMTVRGLADGLTGRTGRLVKPG
jgi:rhamnosyltransferase